MSFRVVLVSFSLKHDLSTLGFYISLRIHTPPTWFSTRNLLTTMTPQIVEDLEFMSKQHLQEPKKEAGMQFRTSIGGGLHLASLSDHDEITDVDIACAQYATRPRAK